MELHLQGPFSPPGHSSTLQIFWHEVINGFCLHLKALEEFVSMPHDYILRIMFPRWLTLDLRVGPLVCCFPSFARLSKTSMFPITAMKAMILSLRIVSSNGTFGGKATEEVVSFEKGLLLIFKQNPWVETAQGKSPVTLLHGIASVIFAPQSISCLQYDLPSWGPLRTMITC